jgi:hypothetical protein
MAIKLKQYFPFQDPSKYSQSGIFGTQIHIPSGNPLFKSNRETKKKYKKIPKKQKYLEDCFFLSTPQRQLAAAAPLAPLAK